MIIRAVKIFHSVFAHSLVVVLENVVTPPLQRQVFFRVVKKMKMNSLGLILIEKQCQLFLIVKLRKGLFQLLLFLFHSNA